MGAPVDRFVPVPMPDPFVLQRSKNVVDLFNANPIGAGPVHQLNAAIPARAAQATRVLSVLRQKTMESMTAIRAGARHSQWL
jgi:hypothetical protein